ncbi:glycosyltransferase family 87 protein [Dongia sp.]|uniref:glycosyltransferase family 87 protein n=1 Tax=Dongia sp. TaxID=1977262 RepID=UPI0035AD90FB
MSLREAPLSNAWRGDAWRSNVRRSNAWRSMGPLVFANFLVVLALLTQWLKAIITGDLGFRDHVIGLDFVNTWLGARLTLAGDVGALFDFGAYNKLLQGFFGADLPGHIWSYPPHLLPLIAPLGAVPYVAGYALWCALTLLLFLWGARSLGFRGVDLLLLATSPAIAMNIVVGQTGALAAGCLMLALGYAARRPFLAGIAAALLTVKPQYGMLLPIAWLLQRRFRAIGFAILATLLLIAISIATVGWPAWEGFINVTTPAMREVMLSGELPAARLMRPNWASSLQLLDVPTQAAFLIQSIISVVIAALWLRLAWRNRGANAVASRPELALLLLGSVLVTPYIHNYDLVLTAPVVLWAWRDPALLNLDNHWRRLLLILAWLLPWLMIPLHQVQIIVAPVLLTLLVLLLFRTANRFEPKAP